MKKYDQTKKKKKKTGSNVNGNSKIDSRNKNMGHTCSLIMGADDAGSQRAKVKTWHEGSTLLFLF